MGIWERLWGFARRRGVPPAVEVALTEPEPATGRPT
jgi:hypothetical protein